MAAPELDDRENCTDVQNTLDKNLAARVQRKNSMGERGSQRFDGLSNEVKTPTPRGLSNPRQARKALLILT